ncbi:MAG: PCI domain-containing protein [Promethearchaeota archaeon]
MSFALLKERVIDTGLCIYCGLCSRNCKHIGEVISPKKAEKNDTQAKLPQVKRNKCIMTRHGLKCGLCYDNCPVIKKKKELTEWEQIHAYIESNQNISIPDVAKALNLPTLQVRYDVLRMVQEKQIQMSLDVSLEYPLFSTEMNL